jgi:hypothetical protein
VKPGGALKLQVLFVAATAMLLLLAAPTDAVALEALFPYANGDSEPGKTKKDVGAEKRLPLPAKTKDTGAEKKFSFPPFYIREKTAKRELTQVLWPLYAHEKTAAGEEYRQIINLYMSDRSVKRNTNRKGVLWVGLWLAEWGHEGNLSKTALRPFVSFERNEEDAGLGEENHQYGHFPPLLAQGGREQRLFTAYNTAAPGRIHKG